MTTTFISTMDIYKILKDYIDETSRKETLILLDSFIELAIEKNDYSFSSGLLGAGWLMSYLHQEEFIKEDIDELLYDFDDNFYKIAIKVIVDENTLLDDLFDIITYHQQRIQNKLSKHNFHRRFALYETMKLLTEKLRIKLLYGNLSYYEVSRILLKMSYLNYTCLNEKDIEGPFYKNMENLISYYQQIKLHHIVDNDVEILCYLLLTSKQYVNPYWVTCIEELLRPIDVCDPVLKNLVLIASLYSPGSNDFVSIAVPESQGKNKLFFLLAANLKSVSFYQ